MIVTKIQVDKEECPVGLVLAKYYSRPSSKRSARAYIENVLQKDVSEDSWKQSIRHQFRVIF